MKRSLLVIILTLCMLLLCSVPAFAAETAELNFTASEPDADGYFDVTVSVKNATFNVIGFVLRYDPEVIRPVMEDGAPAEYAVDSYTIPQGLRWLSFAGDELDTENGIYMYSAYVQPGTKFSSGGVSSVEGHAAVGSEELVVGTIHLQKIGNTSPVLELALAEEGKPYYDRQPDGGGLYGNGYRLTTNFNFDFEAVFGSSSNIQVDSTDPNADEEDEDDEVAKPSISDISYEQRSYHTVLLMVDNPVAVVRGALKAIDTNRAVTPYIDANSRTLVPVRFLSENLGATVDYTTNSSGLTDKVIITKDDITVVLTIGSRTYTVNNIVKTMDTAPVVNSAWGRTMLPARYVAEALGYDVEWDNPTRSVIITPETLPWDNSGSVEQSLISNWRASAFMYGGLI